MSDSFVLKLHGVIVGRSDLEERDGVSRRVSGVFRPGPGYELVEPVFALRTSDPARYRRALEKLKLDLVDSTGTAFAVSDVAIETDEASTGLRIRATVTSGAFWKAS
jgi:hypothetical protein